jgi:co-chaperonin GroES (HSP10)
MQVLLHHVLVRAESLEETDPIYKRAASAGIQLATSHEDFKRQEAGLDRGTVVQIGPTAFRDYNVECPISVGDFVGFAKYAGKLIADPEHPENKFIVLNDEDIHIILKRAA